MDPNFFWIINVLDHNFVDQIFLTKKSFGPIFFNQQFFWTQDFFDPKFFGQKTFGTQNSFGAKFYSDPIFVSTPFFTNTFLIQNFFLPKTSDPFFKLRLGALIPRSVGLSGCLSQLQQKNIKLYKSPQNITKHQKAIK